MPARQGRTHAPRDDTERPIRVTALPLLAPSRPYSLFTREERHFAAVLFHLLCLPGNAQAMLDAFDTGWSFDDAQGGVYFEYSYLRDHWNALGHGNTTMAEANPRRRDVLAAVLRAFGAGDALLGRVEGATVAELNGLFIANPSKEQVQSPANWQVARFAAAGSGLESRDIAAAARVKWAFRIKPDLVVQPCNGRALCLELKFESGEASYPSKGAERLLLKPHMGLVRQSDLQRDMLQLVFGAANTRCGFITQGGGGKVAAPGGLIHRSWEEVLGRLTCPPVMPRFVRDALRLCRAAPLSG